jgi:hypothetical protein
MRVWSRPSWGAAALVVLIGLAGGAPASARPPVRQLPAAVVRLEPGSLGRPLPSGFDGLAMEYPTLPAYAGTNPQAINPLLVTLIRDLSPGQAPVLRIGGDSTDWTWWPTHGQRQPPGVSYTLTPTWMATARALVRQTDAQMILGVNLEADNVAIASAEGRALLAGIGRANVAALEVGNEPELYSVLAWAHVHGKAVVGRLPGYSFADFTKEFSAIGRSLPPIELAGPATGNLGWLSDVPALVQAQPEVKMITVHRYALNRCNMDHASPGYPSIVHLLAPWATAPQIAYAHRHGLTFRVDELNSVTCGGQWGVSNTFASALWMLNALFTIDSSGADGVNIQTAPYPGGANALFDFTQQGTTWQATVNPLYYGVLAFAVAAPAGAQLIKLQTANTGSVSSWATLTPSGEAHVVLINDDLTGSHTVALPALAGNPATPATLEYLQAPAASSTGDVTLGGQSFAPVTSTGALMGPLVTSTVTPSGGHYTVTVPTASAAILTIPGVAKPH